MRFVLWPLFLQTSRSSGGPDAKLCSQDYAYLLSHATESQLERQLHRFAHAARTLPDNNGSLFIGAVASAEPGASKAQCGVDQVAETLHNLCM